MKKTLLSRWRANFFTGLALVLPGVISIGIFAWLFGTVANFTDKLLFFLPQSLTHADGGKGAILWQWSLIALVVAILIITLVGQLARIYIGRKLLALGDRLLLQIPLLNKIYSTLKQVNEAFGPSSKSSFKQVVLVEFPHAGAQTIGFITSDDLPEVRAKTGPTTIAVFVPTTPNPTAGFLLLLPEEKVTKLDMSVADGIKFIISLGAVSPEFRPGQRIVVNSADRN